MMRKAPWWVKVGLLLVVLWVVGSMASAIVKAGQGISQCPTPTTFPQPIVTTGQG